MVALKGFVFKDLPVSRRKHSPKGWIGRELTLALQKNQLCRRRKTMKDMQHAFFEILAGTKSQHELTFGAR
jgi:hypothetical protein